MEASISVSKAVVVYLQALHALHGKNCCIPAGLSDHGILLIPQVSLSPEDRTVKHDIPEFTPRRRSVLVAVLTGMHTRFQ